jgi:hypothetical protein
MAIPNILRPFGRFFGSLAIFPPGLVHCTKKNLATLAAISCQKMGAVQANPGYLVKNIRLMPESSLLGKKTVIVAQKHVCNIAKQTMHI